MAWFEDFLASKGVHTPWFDDVLKSQGVSADPPPKKKFSLSFGPQLRALEQFNSTGKEEIADQVAAAKADPRAFMMGMIGPGELGIAKPGKLLARLLEPGGATLTRAGEHFAGSGYMVADPALTLTSKSADEIAAFVKRADVQKALKAGGHYGKWTDPETGVSEINVSRAFKTPADAIAVAGPRKEKAIGRIVDGKYEGDIPVPPERIVAASTRYADGREFDGFSHGHAMNAAEKAGIPKGSGVLLPDGSRLGLGHSTDGFRTNWGRFLTRDEAGKAVGGSTSERAIGETLPQTSVPPKVGAAASRFWIPGEKEPRVFTGRIHPQANHEAEQQLGDLLDQNFEPRFRNEEGFVAEDGKTWLTRAEALASAKYHKQLPKPYSTAMREHLQRLDKNGQLKAETIGQYAGNSGYADATIAKAKAPIEPPAIHVPDAWKPTERGVFDRTAASLQGKAEVDPRLMAHQPKAGISPLIQAISESPTVERGLLADTEKGLPKGGHSWYELGPMAQSYGEMGGPMSFADWVNASGSGSIQNPTHNELGSASILLYAKKHGIPWQEAVQAFKKAHPREPNPYISGGMASNFNRADKTGIHLPGDPSEAKVPWYSQGKRGGAIEGMPALDTHERRRLLQLARQDPEIAGKIKNAGISSDPMEVLPIKSGHEYEALGWPYQRMAQALDLPSTQAAQAGRWLGGGEHTGLLSAPFGDYVQTVEDGLLYTAKTRGLDQSPKGLKNLWQRIAQGEDFFTPLYTRKGGFPVYGK